MVSGVLLVVGSGQHFAIGRPQQRLQRARLHESNLIGQPVRKQRMRQPPRVPVWGTGQGVSHIQGVHQGLLDRRQGVTGQRKRHTPILIQQADEPFRKLAVRVNPGILSGRPNTCQPKAQSKIL